MEVTRAMAAAWSGQPCTSHCRWASAIGSKLSRLLSTTPATLMVGRPSPQDGRSGGIQLGWRFSMNAAMPSRGSGEVSSAPNIVW